jgi:hypothetical protein
MFCAGSIMGCQKDYSPALIDTSDGLCAFRIRSCFEKVFTP